MTPGTKRWIVAIPAVVGIVLGSVVLYRTATEASAACGTPFAEAIDPNSSVHLLPGTPSPRYVTDPPTSGAHRPGEHETGVLTTPIEEPVQVALLEHTEVLVQYRGVPSATRSKLNAFARDAERVTVAPNPSLKKPIVATAWLWKMECSSFDAGALRDFVDAHQPEQPVSD